MTASLFCFGQHSPKGKMDHFKKNKIFKPDTKLKNSTQFFDFHRTQLGIDQEWIEMKSSKRIEAKHSVVHERFKQYYKGIEIFGSNYTLHQKDGIITSATGNLFPNITHVKTGNITKKSAIERAHESMVHRYYSKLENVDFEKITSNAESYRSVVIDRSFPQYSGEFIEAWEIIMFIDDYIPRKDRIFISKVDGKEINHFTEICEHNVEGTVVTRYYGTQKVVTDSIGPDQYVLRDYSRGEGVFTLNGLQKDAGFDDGFGNFKDSDNHWENFNDDQDEVAGDAHYCASSFYDFMADLGWDGVDGEGGSLISIVHARDRYYLNAFWDGVRTQYGNGDCDEYGPLTTLDVVGHEFLHGVITNSSALVYRNESGALNESIADIFGKALQYAYDPENFSWYYGDSFRTDPEARLFRSMNDPNELEDPKFYGGEHWYSGKGDNGGVHSNSGVFNYWYYLLVEGVSGINEAGVAFDVPSVGWDKATEIVYELTVAYLTENSNYFDAMELSIEVTEQLFGQNSTEFNAVVEAWKAVGLYSGINENDLALVVSVEDYYGCPNSIIYPEISFANHGNSSFDTGYEILLNYKTDQDSIVESYILENEFLPGDTLTYTFNTGVNYDPDIDRKLHFKILNEELNNINNNAEAEIRFYEIEGKDMELLDFQFRKSDECLDSEYGSFRIQFKHVGCLSIPDTDTLTLRITTDLETKDVPYVLYRPIDPSSTTIAFRGFANDIEFQSGFTNYSVELLVPGDEEDGNNIFEGKLETSNKISAGYIERFEDSDFDGYFKMAYLSFFAEDSILRYQDNPMLAIASTRTSTNPEKCDQVQDFYSENSNAFTIEGCLDATDMELPALSMDMAQFRNSLETIEGIDDQFTVIAQVQLDTVEYPLIYGQADGEIINHEFDIPEDYRGGFQISAVILSGLSEPYDDGSFGDYDMLLLDNLRLVDRTTMVDENQRPEFKIFPNPTADMLNITNNHSDSTFSVSVIDNIGQVIYKNISASDGVQIDVSKWPSGVYFCQIKDFSNFSLVNKFIKI